MMDGPTVGLVVVASKAEVGGERGETLLAEATAALAHDGLQVHSYPQIVWDASDAFHASTALAGDHLDLLVIIHATWVMDSVQFPLVQGLRVPVLLWALPYPETYSLACVQHCASILWHTDAFCRWGYGLPAEKAFAEQAARLARASRAAQRLSRLKVGLVGPRYTWRTAGPQDTAYDEWDLAKTLGITTLHLEMEDFQGRIAAQAEAEARQVLAAQREQGRLGQVEVSEERLLQATRVYLAARELLTDGLGALTVECYPRHGGLVNLAASWLADDGLVLDSEGDVGHSALARALMDLRPGPCALAEAVLVDREPDLLYLRHEGSAAFSLAEDPSLVHVINCGDPPGTIVQFPLRPLECATAASLCGRDGHYRLFLGTLRVERIAAEEWNRLGRGFLAAVRPSAGAQATLQGAIARGMDHHWLLKPGDLAAEIQELAALTGMACVNL